MSIALDREQDGHIRVLETFAHSALLGAGNLSAFYEQAKAVMSGQPACASIILADQASHPAPAVRHAAAQGSFW